MSGVDRLDGVQTKARNFTAGGAWTTELAERDGPVAIALLVLVLVFNVPFFGLPYFWDSLWIIPGAEYVQENAFRPILPASWDSEGHPVLFHEILALSWSVLGQDVWVSHLVVAGIAFVAVLYTFRLARLLYDRPTGITAALLFLFYPLFRAQSTIVVLDLPVTAFALMAIYFLAKRQTALYLLFASTMVLTKGTSALIMVPVLIYVLVQTYPQKSWPETARILAVHAIPLVLLAAWFWYHKQTTGWWPFIEDGIITPRNVLAMYLPPVLFTRAGALYQAAKLGWQYFGGKTAVGLLTLVILVHCISFRPFFDVYRPKFSPRALVEAMRVQRPWSTWGPRGTLVLLGLPIALHLFFMASTTQLQRYLLPEYALFFILAAKALRDVLATRKAAVIATGAILLIFVLSWTRSWPTDQLASPSNLTYIDFVSTHQEAAAYIENHYPDKITLAGWPQYIEMSVPSLGYVQQPLKVVAYALPLRYFEPRMLALGAGSFSDPQHLTGDDFDLVYLSDHTGTNDVPILQDVIRRFDLPVIAEFRVRDEHVTIYGNPRRIDLPVPTAP